MGSALARGWWSREVYSEVCTLYCDPLATVDALHKVAGPAHPIDHMGVLADSTLRGAMLCAL